MNMTYINKEEKRAISYIMGCYGIGIGRLAASVCEAHHNEVWSDMACPLRHGRFISV